MIVKRNLKDITLTLIDHWKSKLPSDALSHLELQLNSWLGSY
jgi:hypothetical protein